MSSTPPVCFFSGKAQTVTIFQYGNLRNVLKMFLASLADFAVKNLTPPPPILAEHTKVEKFVGLSNFKRT